ncbi:ATP synthase subunit I [Paucibacter sp. APW11]|uniref:ATP synthase subunit I n=1 Tax=Roseateles aquae TaxID=3077235 RepID=A0ABU3PBX3_9BURK|nr:ATP synthase subunit I [Paucibacter sp. APW11]MDT9000059.1 ATP synthase subunit I [Paucibacter sp. APW11]
MNPNLPRAEQKAAAQVWEQDRDASAVGEDDFKDFTPLSREQAEALRARQPAISPWRVVVAQALAGVAMVALWGLLALGSGKWWSALCGAAAVVFPNALMAWGTTRRPATDAGAALMSVMFWELIKIVLVSASLLVVIKWVPDLSWPALLTTMIVCLKVNWLVLLRRGRFKSISDGN